MTEQFTLMKETDFEKPNKKLLECFTSMDNSILKRLKEQLENEDDTPKRNKIQARIDHIEGLKDSREYIYNEFVKN